MQKPPTWELTEAVHTTAVAPLHIPVASASGATLPPSGMFGPHDFGPQNIVIINSNTIDATKKSYAQEYQSRASQLAQTIEHELAATRLEGSTHPLPPAEAIIRELGVRNTLILRKSAELHQKTALANLFYGGDPFNRSLLDFYRKASTMEARVMPGGLAMQAWTASYRAAHDARLLAQSIQMLNQQHVNVLNWLASVQASDQVRIAAQQEAQRAAAELARINEQARLAALAETARRQKEQQEIQAREQARLAALAEAQRLAAEQAQIAAQAAAQQIAAEQARQQAQADIQRRNEERLQLAEKNRQEKQQKALRKAQKRQRKKARKIAREQAQRQAENAKTGQPPIFANAGSMAAWGPTFTGPLGVFGNNLATTLALRTSLQTAVSLALAAISTAAAPMIVGFAALLAPSKLGNSDLYSVSVPLSDLAPDLNADLQHLAAVGATVDLPVRLGSSTMGDKVEFVVVTTDGVTVPAHVPVRAARFDASKNVYVSTASDTNGPTLTWTPLVQAQDTSTNLPLADTDPPVYDGAEVVPDEGRIDPFPELDRYGFGGFITVFPIESGLPPTFTMFRDRRQEPGVASGFGQPVSDTWRSAAATAQGAPIPERIASKLRDRQFSSFKAFRREFWKAVGNDEFLSGQFTALRQVDMKQGLSPVVPTQEQVGGRLKYEIHHETPIETGGAVYDMDNLKIMTPKQHISIHSKNGGELK